jgi:hypothetical protein
LRVDQDGLFLDGYEERECVEVIDSTTRGADVAVPKKPLVGGRIEAPDEYRRRLEGTKFVFTCAQNNTAVHPEFWKALLTFCEVENAQLGVAKTTYNINAWEKASGITKDEADEQSNDIWYDPCIHPYLITEQVKVADDLLFCAELDILPTNVFPLNGLQNYTGHNSAIVPHTKMQMQSLATMKHKPAKLMYTTGACTMRNYIKRRAGQIAEYHHVYGAILVEIDPAGEWFVRQLNADDLGMFYDLDKAYGPGWCRPASDFGFPIVNLGDIHIEKLDHVAWAGALDMLAKLQPEAIMVHDLIDFEARNHHNKKDPHFQAQMLFSGNPSVEAGIKHGMQFMRKVAYDFPLATVYSIRSNHDEALLRWLREELKDDPVNARYWHKMNYLVYSRIEEGATPDVFSLAMRATGFGEFPKNVRFIKEDDSLVINDIEFGMHGHLGPNGARGNPKAFRQIGTRANTGHTHSAGIVDGIYTAGVLATLNMGYNKGPSSWSQSHIVTYPNGKRTIITQRGAKWRA